MPRLHTLLVCLIALGLAAGSARAQETPDIEKAKAHYSAAEAAMQAGDHARAATEYAAAYEITKDPVLHYKRATAHEQAGQCDQAVTWYRRYLVEGAPDEHNAGVTQERIAACEARLAQPGGAAPDATAGQEGADASAPADQGEVERERPDERAAPDSDAGEMASGDDLAPPLREAPPSFIDRATTWQSKAAWSSLTAGIGFGIAGAVLAISASAQEQDLENLIAFRYPNGEPAEYSGTVAARYEDIVDKGKTHATWSRIAFAAAGASVGAAVVFFVLDARSATDEKRAAHVVPVIAPESVGLAAGWRF